jgi:hypothetical protein
MRLPVLFQNVSSSGRQSTMSPAEEGFGAAVVPG